MNRTVVGRAGLALGLLLAVPQLAAAQETIWTNTTCGGATLQACVDFTLVDTKTTDALGNRIYEFSFKYASSLAAPRNQGRITAGGILDPSELPDFDFYDVQLVYAPAGKTWFAYDDSDTGFSNCQHLNGGGNNLLEACGDGAGGINNGLDLGEWVTFRFTSYQNLNGGLFTNNSTLADLAGRVHYQGYGSDECSFKLDSRLGVVSPPEGGIDGCGNVVPEPMTLLLLGTGLLGVGAVGVVRRNNQV